MREFPFFSLRVQRAYALCQRRDVVPRRDAHSRRIRHAVRDERPRCVRPRTSRLPLLNAHTPGHFFFTELLMPALEEAAKSAPDGHARVVTTSSSGAYGDTLHWETFRDDRAARTKLGTHNLYFQSKFVSPCSVPAPRRARAADRRVSLFPRRATWSSRARSRGATPTRASSRSPATPVRRLVLFVRMCRRF